VAPLQAARMMPRISIASLLVATLGAAAGPHDAGPPEQIRAVRAVMARHYHAGLHGPAHVGPIHVRGRWAAAWWQNDGGGTALLQRANGRWTLITGGGGMMCAHDLTQYMALRDARLLLGADQLRLCALGGH
jgi:hypothetical protein